MIKRSIPLRELLKLGEECRRCGHCCSKGSGFVVSDDLERIARHLEIDKKELVSRYLEKTTLFNTEIYKFKTRAKPFGECVFLEDNKCSIHEVKPLHCRIGNCGEHGEELNVWFLLNYLVDEHDPESVRQWKLYLESGGKNIKEGELEELVPDKETLKKILDYDILM